MNGNGAFFLAKVTHDNLKREPAEKGFQKVLMYIVEAEDYSMARKKTQALESQFQGLNFEVLSINTLTTLGKPLFMGIHKELC